MRKEETDADKYIEAVAKAKEAERTNDVQRWVQKESFSSNWRQDLSEIMTDDIDSKPIKEKKVNNKIKINPKLGEAVEKIGGEILEMTEVKEGDGDPCWDSHKQVGMKKKGGKMVPNCVPKNEEVEVDEAMSSYDRNRKRAAQRAADRNAARAAGKTGVVPGVGYVTPRKEKETYTDEKGTVRHKSGARNEEVETEVEEGYKELSRDKRNTMFRKAGNLSRTALQGGDKGTEAGKKSGKIVKALNKDAEKYNRNDVKEDSSMSPQEIQLQKKKARIDRMIAQKRQQDLNKTKKSEAPTKAMGEEAACAHSVKGKECPVHGKKDCSSMDEATEDSLRDRRMERGGVDGNNRYNSAPKNVAMGGGKKKPYDGMSALEKVKASIRAKHGQGAIMDTKKK
jgi:hypothetical protein